MAATKKVGRPRKKTTAKKTEDINYPVDEMVNEMKNILFTENENTKKKDELKAAKEEERKAAYKDKDNTEETEPQIEEQKVDDSAPVIKPEEIETEEPVSEADPEPMVTETVGEPVQDSATQTYQQKRCERFLTRFRGRKKLTQFRQIGQIIDY